MENNRACDKKSVIPNKSQVLTLAEQEKQKQSVSELNSLYQSFNENFLTKHCEWDWLKRWNEHWRLFYPNWYAGMYINQNQEPVVLVTKSDDELLTYIRKITNNSNILVNNAKYSWGDLCYFQEVILAKLLNESDIAKLITSTGPDFFSGKIFISVLDNEESSSLSKFQDFRSSVKKIIYEDIISKSTELPADIVGFEFATERPNLTSKLPGSRISDASSFSAYASLGYRAKWTQTDASIKYGNASTGHMTQWSVDDTMYSRLNSSGTISSLGTLKGIWRPSSTPGQDDFCFIEVSNPSNVIANSSGTSHTAYVSIPVIGINVYLSGSATASIASGVVENTNRSLTDTTLNVTVNNLIGLTGGNNFIINGDSGGIVYNPSNRGVIGLIEGYQLADYLNQTNPYSGPYGYVVSSIIFGNKYNIWPN